MKTINVSGARNRLPSLIEEVVQTREQVVVTRYGAPLVAIMPFRDTRSTEGRYPLRGHPIALADDFDAPMPRLWDALAV
jgi:prevent-host-death family protein